MSVQTQIDRISGNVSAALTAIADKGVTVPDGSNSDALAELIASIQAGGSAPGEVFGSSKYEAGSIIGDTSGHVFVPTPTWFSNTDKLNFIVFTVPTYPWDAPYMTFMCKIQREAVTISGYTTNDDSSIYSFNPSFIYSPDYIQISFNNSTYTIGGYEYFYILWENE